MHGSRRDRSKRQSLHPSESNVDPSKHSRWPALPTSTIISREPHGLSDECSVSRSTSKKWLLSISKSLAPARMSARDYGHLQRQYVSTGMPSLDAFLRGGLPVAQLVELYGPAGSGKTQVLMSIAVAVLAGEGRVFWFDSERTLHPERFQSLCEHRSPHAPIEGMLSRMAIKECDDLLDLIRGVEALKTIPTCEGVPCLVVIDSVAASARCTEDIILSRMEGDKSEGSDAAVLAERQSLLNRLAVALKGAAWVQRAAVVVSNHVTADFDSNQSDAFKPALGLTWSHAVNIRLMINRVEESSQREIVLTKSTQQMSSSCSVRITIDCVAISP